MVMTNYIALALLGAFFYSLSGIAGKIATTHKFSNLYALFFWLNLLTLPFIPILILFGGLQNPLPALWPLLASGVLILFAAFIGWWVLFRIDITTVQPLYHLGSIYTATLAFIFLGERFPLQIYGWIAFIILGGMLVTYDEQLRFKSIFRVEFLLMAVAILFGSISDVTQKLALEAGVNPWNYRIWTGLIIFVLAIPFAYLGKGELKARPRQLWPLVANNGLGIAAGTAVGFAYLSNVTISQTLAMFGSLFTLVLISTISQFYPKWLEHHPPKVYFVRAIGTALMLLAAIMITKGT